MSHGILSKIETNLQNLSNTDGVGVGRFRCNLPRRLGCERRAVSRLRLLQTHVSCDAFQLCPIFQPARLPRSPCRYSCSGCDSLFSSLMLLEHHKEEFEHWSDYEDDRRLPCCRRNRRDEDDYTDTESGTSDAESEDLERLL